MSDRCEIHGKVCYASQRDAAAALYTIRHKSKKGRVPCRAYFDSVCRSWHLTSLRGAVRSRR